MAFTPVTLTGTFRHPDGTNATGTVSAVPSSSMVNGVTITDLTPIVGTVTAGALSMSILATDDTGTAPSGAFYTFTVQLDGIAPVETFTAPISHLVTPLDFSALTPVVISPPISATYSLAALDLRYAPFGGTVNPTTPDVVAPVPSGGDDAVALNALISALPAAGGRIVLPRGSYTWNTTVNLDSKSNVTLRGAGGVTAGATGSTDITYTPASGAAISARSSIGIHIEDVALRYSNAAYGGNLIDFSHVTASDSSDFAVSRCFIGGGSSKLTAPSLIFLDKANSGVIEGCLFSGGLVAILGRLTDNTHYSNAHLIQNCSFVGFVTCHIRNPGDGWTIIGNTFENLVTSGGVLAGAGSLGWSAAAFTTRGLSYIGNWHGDANTTGTWVSVSSALLLGATFTGNYFGSGSIGISLGVASLSGITIVGNTFDQMAFGVGINTTTSRAFLIHANTFTSMSSGPIGFGGGTMPVDSVIQNEDVTNVGGDLLGMVRLVAGAVSDGSFPVPPPNGTFGFDTTGLQLYFRTGGVWKKTAALT